MSLRTVTIHSASDPFQNILQDLQDQADNEPLRSNSLSANITDRWVVVNDVHPFIVAGQALGICLSTSKYIDWHLNITTCMCKNNEQIAYYW